MSKQIAMDNICLKPTTRWAHTEYSMGYHHEYLAKLAAGNPDVGSVFNDKWVMDFIWSIDNGLHGDWLSRGRATNMGHAVYASDGSDMVQPKTCPFETLEEVWAFDAVAEYGLPDFAEQVKAYEANYQQGAASSDQVFTGGYYNTIISGAIQAFGWEMLLMGFSDPKKMEKVLDSFFRFTLHHMKAWAETSVEVIIQHDDFVWTAGPFVSPEIYRSVIIPRYAELWKPLKAAGKKVLFCSDGTFMEFFEDVAAAGADGFIFEPSNDFATVAERFGSSHCLVGSAVDCRDMTFGTWESVQKTIDITLEAAEKHCKGLIFAVGNHIPANVPDDMLTKYIDYLLPRLSR